jgi:hypothetical protein
MIPLRTTQTAKASSVSFSNAFSASSIFFAVPALTPASFSVPARTTAACLPSSGPGQTNS